MLASSLQASTAFGLRATATAGQSGERLVAGMPSLSASKFRPTGVFPLRHDWPVRHPDAQASVAKELPQTVPFLKRSMKKGEPTDKQGAYHSEESVPRKREPSNGAVASVGARAHPMPDTLIVLGRHEAVPLRDDDWALTPMISADGCICERC